MARPRLRLALVFSLALAALGAAWNAQAITITPEQAGISNFGQVDDNYFRGARPDAKAVQRLKELGIKTVIDLQEDPLPGEATWVKDAGLQYYNIRLSGSVPATDAETAQFLSLVNDPKNLPVYVHCQVGKHRTGAMTGIYRITHDAWTADQAYAEMQKFGYYSFPNHGRLKSYVYSYYDAHRTALAAAGAGEATSGAGEATSAAAR